MHGGKLYVLEWREKNRYGDARGNKHTTILRKKRGKLLSWGEKNY